MTKVKDILYCDNCASLNKLSTLATKMQGDCKFCGEDEYCNIGPGPKPKRKPAPKSKAKAKPKTAAKPKAKAKAKPKAKKTPKKK